MNSHPHAAADAPGLLSRLFFQRESASPLPLLICVSLLIAAWHANAGTNVVVWDSLTPLGANADMANRADWKAVPNDLLALEADPSKASSDPGYYGREYTFRGDAIVENRTWLAVFGSTHGRVILYSKSTPSAAAPAGTVEPAIRKFAELAPFGPSSQEVTITRCEILRNSDDEAALTVTFASPGSAEVTSVF